MELTESQRDALTEMVNIATARTAAALSELSGARVLLAVPQVGVYPIHTLSEVLSAFIKDDIVTIHQIFSGPVSGDALLLVGYHDAMTLVDLLTDEHIQATRLNESAREVLTEIGNILLNACLSVFGDLLQVHVSFSVPRLHSHELNRLMNSVIIGRQELQYGLVAHTNFSLHDNSVSGYLVLILGVTSLDRLIEAIEHFG